MLLRYTHYARGVFRIVTVSLVMMTEAYCNCDCRLLGVPSPFFVLALSRHSPFSEVIATDLRISNQFLSMSSQEILSPVCRKPARPFWDTYERTHRLGQITAKRRLVTYDELYWMHHAPCLVTL